VPIQRDEFGIPISYEDQPDLHDIHGFYRKGRGEFRVAIMDTGIVGSIATLDIGAGYRERSGCTAQDVRKKRIPRFAARHGAARTLLQCLVAHRFYEKAGFELTDEQSLSDRFPRMTVDTRFYRLMLVKEPFSSRLQ
jgi:hypothetical protein